MSGRRFELTWSVWTGERMPETAREWADLMFGTEGLDLPAVPTRLERVVETRHPPASDVVERRRERSTKTSMYQ